MSHIPGHVSLVSRVDRVLSKENMDACAQIRKLLLSFVLPLVYRICGIQRRGNAFTKTGTRQVASTPRQTAAPEAGPVSREIFFMRFAA